MYVQLTEESSKVYIHLMQEFSEVYIHLTQFPAVYIHPM